MFTKVDLQTSLDLHWCALILLDIKYLLIIRLFEHIQLDVLSEVLPSESFSQCFQYKLVVPVMKAE